MPYVFELPTTGAVSFSDLCIDNSGAFTSRLADVTSARANVRGVLKETKRAGNERDYLHVIKALDDYLPHLYALIGCLSADDLVLRGDAIFSWRSTLSNNLLNTSPRLNFPGIQADLHFSLLTYAFSLCNFASSVVVSLEDYERQRYTSEADRKSNDERLNLAVTFLCRASGVFAHLSETVLPELLRIPQTSALPRVPDDSKEVILSLAKLSIADAQLLAIRKLLAKSQHDATLSPGPPLPKGHPSPGLLAKLYLFVLDTYSSALTLARTPSSKSASSSTRVGSPSVLSKVTDGKGEGEITAALRRYISDEIALASALSHKWLGIESGEAGRSGEAIAYLVWAKEDLENAKESKLKSVVAQGGKREKEMASERKDRIVDEIKLVRSFLDNYTMENNSVNFQPVPSRKSLQASLPSGRAAVVPKSYAAPEPAFFGPSSLARQTENLSISEDSVTPGSSARYAGAGSYF